MRIRKTSQSAPLPGARVVNQRSNSTTDAYSADYINKLDTYSTTEQVIGTWIDGKPLYRKVIFNQTLSTGSGGGIWQGLITLSDYNIDKVIDINGYIDGDQGRLYVGKSEQIEGTGVSCISRYGITGDGSTLYVLCEKFSNNVNISLTTTIEYTKTTDTATN